MIAALWQISLLMLVILCIYEGIAYLIRRKR